MLFMVIEWFRNCDPKPIYRRLRDRGRQMPDGLKYIDSWITPTFDRCFQLMECDDARLLQQWIVHWGDLLAVLGGLADVERDLIRTPTAEGRRRAKRPSGDARRAPHSMNWPAATM